MALELNRPVRNPGVPSIVLNNTRVMPQLGIGVWQIANESAPGIVGAAFKAGYRAVDTAANYGNEVGVGRAVRQSAIPRHEIHVTTKLWNDGHGYDHALRAFDASLRRLGLDWVDLYLIHWPCPQKGLYVETWRALAELQRQGRVKSIGVSNFAVQHLERISESSGVMPAVNQIELHPRFQQKQLREFHRRYGIRTAAWSPLGQGSCLSLPAIRRIAARHGRSAAQVVLRWHVESGIIVIPKSASPIRLAENSRIFDFELTPDDHSVLSALDRPDGRIGPDPLIFGQSSLVRRIARPLKVMLRPFMRVPTG